MGGDEREYVQTYNSMKTSLIATHLKTKKEALKYVPNLNDILLFLAFFVFIIFPFIIFIHIFMVFLHALFDRLILQHTQMKCAVMEKQYRNGS